MQGEDAEEVRWRAFGHGGSPLRGNALKSACGVRQGGAGLGIRGGARTLRDTLPAHPREREGASIVAYTTIVGGFGPRTTSGNDDK